MVFFIYGEDSYRARRELNEIIEKEKKSHVGGIRLCYLEDQGLTLQNLRNATASLSMFGEKNVAVLRGVFSDKKFKEEFLGRGKEFLDSKAFVLIYEDGGIDKRDALFKFLLKAAECFEFPKLEGAKLKSWFEGRARKLSLEIEPKAEERLIFSAGQDLWLLDNEMKKLAGFCKGRKVTQADVDLLVRPKIESDIFKTIDAISQKNKKEALGLLHNHLQKGESPLYLLSMINFQFRNLLEIKDLIEKKITYAQILKRSSLHPFVIKKTYWQAGKFTLSQLKRIYSRIFKTDLDIKTGRIEPEAALDLLIGAV